MLFRADASAAIGTGHIGRSLALAEELVRRGITTGFAQTAGSAAAGSLITASGHRLVPVDPSLGGDPRAEVDAILATVGPRASSARPFDAVVVDHYGIAEAWLRESRRLARRRMVIDDLADRRLACELLVDPNLGASGDRYRDLVPATARLLLGVRYALLRHSFAVAHATPGLRDRSGPVRRLLVSFGGSDPTNATAMAVRAALEALPDARLDVVLGVQYRHEPAWHAAPRVSVHRGLDGEAMAELMVAADLAVGAGGTTSWERCSVGLPAVAVRIADNQDRVIAGLAAAGVAVDAGWAGAAAEPRLVAEIRRLAGDGARRSAMRQRAFDLVDGLGAVRVAHHLEGVHVRAARPSDARLLWSWANDPATRDASIHPEPIPWPSHRSWLAARLAEPSTQLLIGYNRAGPLGQVRFERTSELSARFEISISVAPEQRGTVGGLLLESGLRAFHRRHPDEAVLARVKESNAPSRALFEHAGFVAVEQRGSLVYYLLPPAPRSSSEEPADPDQHERVAR